MVKDYFSAIPTIHKRKYGSWKGTFSASKLCTVIEFGPHVLEHLYFEMVDEPTDVAYAHCSVCYRILYISNCFHQWVKRYLFSHWSRTLVKQVHGFSERWLYSHLFANVQEIGLCYRDWEAVITLLYCVGVSNLRSFDLSRTLSRPPPFVQSHFPLKMA